MTTTVLFLFALVSCVLWARTRMLTEALRFYADPKTYETHVKHGTFASRDRGQIARRALGMEEPFAASKETVIRW